MSSVRVSLPSEPPSRCEVESSVFTTPGNVNPVAEYDVGKLLDLHQLSLKYNCLLKMEPGSNPSSYPLIRGIHYRTI